jgi:hypothetical protein
VEAKVALEVDLDLEGRAATTKPSCFAFWLLADPDLFWCLRRCLVLHLLPFLLRCLRCNPFSEELLQGTLAPGFNLWFLPLCLLRLCLCEDALFLCIFPASLVRGSPLRCVLSCSVLEER